MKFLKWDKDGGKDSNVWGFFVVEIKPLFSIVLLKFEHGPVERRNLHSHAFNALTWFINGRMTEVVWDGRYYLTKMYHKSLKPKFTPRDVIHRVETLRTSWAFSIRGPWRKTWNEYDPDTGDYIVLTNGRKEVGRWECS